MKCRVQSQVYIHTHICMYHIQGAHTHTHTHTHRVDERMQNVRTAKFHQCLISRQQYHRRLGHSSSSFTFRFLQWTPANFFKKSCFIDFKFIQHLKPTENKFPL